MRHWMITMAVLTVACGGSSPTAPTVLPPVVSNGLPSSVLPLIADPRYDREFYRELVLGSRDLQGQTATLRRQLNPPSFFVTTVDTSGAPIDAMTVEATTNALVSATPLWIGRDSGGVDVGPQPPPNTPHVVVRWDASPTTHGLCAQSDIGGKLITVYLRTPNCQCGGLATRPVVIKHELGHVLGFWHTSSPDDLMYPSGTICDRNPSAREQYHAMIAYQMPYGSAAP